MIYTILINVGRIHSSLQIFVGYGKMSEHASVELEGSKSSGLKVDLCGLFIYFWADIIIFIVLNDHRSIQNSYNIISI